MELTLKMEPLDYCRKTQTVVVSHEETMETAIPDYCPDLGRIVETVGQLKIREKKLSSGRLTVEGTVKVNVLYTSEESGGLRSLQLSVPFSCTIEDARLRGCRSVCASGRLQMVEARAVTARKLYVRVLPEFRVEGIAPRQCMLCTDVPQEPPLHVRREEKTVQVLRSVLERSFRFDQECLPEPGRGTPEDLLVDRIGLQVTGCQRLGNKLVVKGEATVALLYRTEGQDLSSCETVLAFSQILEGAELPEEATYQGVAWAEDSDVRLVRTDSGNAFGISLRIGVMVKVYEELNLSYISDLYSTKCDAKVQWGNCDVAIGEPGQTVHRKATEPLEFGTGRPFAFVTACGCGAVSATPEGDGTALRVPVHVKILYLDEMGAPVTAERTLEAATQVALTPDAVQAVCRDVSLQMGASGCLMTVGVDFCLEQQRSVELCSVSSAECTDAPEKPRPSLVLRRTQGGETLWELGKAYRTDPAAIASLNGLPEEVPLESGMVLIPRVRT